MIESYNQVDKSFNINNINNYHLSLQVHLKGFSYCILDRERNKFIAIGNYYYSKITSYKILVKELEDIYNSVEILTYSYRHVKLLVATPKYSFIPSVFYNKTAAEKTFLFNNDVQKGELILENFIYGNSSYVIYTVPNYLHDFFSNKYSLVKTYHQSCPQIEEILLKNKLLKAESSIHINIYPNFVDIILLKNSKLNLFNSFAYKTNNDFQYFILNTFDQLDLSSTKIPVYISGFIKKNDLKVEALKKYLTDIQFASRPNHFEYSFIFNHIPDHYFLNLINLYQCG